MFVLFISCISSVLGTVSKVLLMSFAGRSIRSEGFSAFRTSRMCCVSVVRSVAVDCMALNPCLKGERGLSG